MAADSTTPINKRERLMQRKTALWQERSSWIAHYQDISDYVLPRAGRYFVTDRNKAKRQNTIYDNTSTRALRVLAAGMMAGMTSPARPWFRLAIADRELMEKGPVKVWLNKVNLLMRDVFNKSNTYRALHSGYEELGAFGTEATILLPDFENVIHHYTLTAGEYAIATNDKGVVDTIVREFQMTTKQMVDKFGKDKCSTTVQREYDSNKLDGWHTVIHLIEPRTDRNPKMRDAKNMKFRSVYMEEKCEQAHDGLLSDSGFRRFPAIVARWVTTGGDIYGTSPGMEALGDIKQLQHEQLRKSQVIDYKTNPPIQVPSQYKDHKKSRLPGGVFHVDTATPGGGVRTAFDVNLDLSHLLEDIQDVRHRIEAAFYADLFLMLSQMDKSGVTATEVAERHEEKLLMLGPVLERLHNELLNPLIDVTFAYCEDAGILPEPPPELQGIELNVEFISTLAQAQRAVGAASYDRLLGTIGQIATLFPDVVDKINIDQTVDDYADMYGVNPEIIVPDDVVQEIRAKRAKALQQQQAAAAAPQAVESAKTVSEINVPGLQDVMSQFQGYSTPSAATQ